MKLFKFLAVFLLVTGLVYLLVVGLNWPVFKTVFDNQDAMADGTEWVEKTYSLAGLTEYMQQQPRHVSLAMIPVNQTGEPVYYGENTPRTLGTTANLFILMEYARQVEAGVLKADERVKLEQLDRYLIRGIDENRNKETRRIMHKSERVSDGAIPLRDLVQFMTERNYLPAADYLFYRLGPDRIRNYARLTGNGRIEAPIPYSGLYMASTEGILNREEFQERALEWGTRIHETGFPEGATVTLSFNEERALYRLFPAGEPEAIARVLKAVWNKELPGSDTIKAVMGWASDATAGPQNLQYFGAIFDSRISLLAGVGFGTSAYTGETYAQAIIFDDLPVGFWLHMSANLMNQDFQQRLIYDPAMLALTKKMIADSASDDSF